MAHIVWAILHRPHIMALFSALCYELFFIQGYLLIKRVCKHATPCGEWGTVDERSFGSKEANQACYDLGYNDGVLDHTGGNGGSGGNNQNKKAFLKFGLKSPHGTGFAQWANLNRFYVSCSALRRRQNQLSDCNLGKVDPKYAMVHGHKNFDLVIQCKSKFTFERPFLIFCLKQNVHFRTNFGDNETNSKNSMGNNQNRLILGLHSFNLLI